MGCFLRLFEDAVWRSCRSRRLSKLVEDWVLLPRLGEEHKALFSVSNWAMAASTETERGKESLSWSSRDLLLVD